MKQCANCGASLEDNALFCNSCGTAQNNEQMPVQDSIEQTSSKGLSNKTAGIIAAVISVIISVSIIAVAAITIFQTASYTKGEVIDGFYVNEWANLKLEITEQWQEADAEQYAEYSDDGTEVGFLTVTESAYKYNVSYIAFEDLTLYTYDSDEYLDAAMKLLKESYDAENISCEMDEYETEIIAGEEYLSVNILVEDYLYQKIFVRIKGKYAIVIACTSIDESSIEEFISSIQPAE